MYDLIYMCVECMKLIYDRKCWMIHVYECPWDYMKVLGTWSDTWSKVNREQWSEIEWLNDCVAYYMCIAYDLKGLATVYSSHWSAQR